MLLSLLNPFLQKDQRVEGQADMFREQMMASRACFGQQDKRSLWGAPKLVLRIPEAQSYSLNTRFLSCDNEILMGLKSREPVLTFNLLPCETSQYTFQSGCSPLRKSKY